MRVRHFSRFSRSGAPQLFRSTFKDRPALYFPRDVAHPPAVQDVGAPVAQGITDHIIAPMFNAAPPQNIEDGSGHLIPNPALMDECQALGATKLGAAVTAGSYFTQLGRRGDVVHACFALTSKGTLFLLDSRDHISVRGCSFDMYRSSVGTLWSCYLPRQTTEGVLGGRCSLLSHWCLFHWILLVSGLRILKLS